MLMKLRETSRDRKLLPFTLRLDHLGPWGYSFVVGTGAKVTAVIVNNKTSILLPAQKSQFAWDTDQAPTEPCAWSILGPDAVPCSACKGLIFKRKYQKN